MEISKDDINQALAAEIRAAKGAAKLPVRVLVERSGIATATLNRILNGEREIKVTQMYLLADALGVAPAHLIERAVQRAEGMAAAAAEEQRLSDASSNVTFLRPGTADEIDKYAGPRAAYRDEEADTDESE